VNWEEILKAFAGLIIKSPIALVTIGVSTCFGYGIAFVLFDYRRVEVKKSHRSFHVAIGLGYAAVVFCVVNFDILAKNITAEQITSRTPLTLIVSGVTSFFIMIAGALWRETYSRPYYTPRRADVDRH
jgi:hypothetical protein